MSCLSERVEVVLFPWLPAGAVGGRSSALLPRPVRTFPFVQHALCHRGFYPRDFINTRPDEAIVSPHLSGIKEHSFVCHLDQLCPWFRAHRCEAMLLNLFKYLHLLSLSFKSFWRLCKCSEWIITTVLLKTFT